MTFKICRQLQRLEIRSCRFAPVRSWILLLVVTAIACAVRLEGQATPSLAQVKSLYVESFGGGNDGALLRRGLIKRLQKAGKYQIVDMPQQADATVKGSGEIWVKGYLTTSSRSLANNRQAVYGGYLSVEVVNQGGEPLWSYLVTPSKFAWASIADDLANNMVKAMLSASQENSLPGVAPGGRQNLARADLKGAGATFPAPLYQKWFESFERLHPEIHITYDAVGSESGTRLLAENKVDFAASDVSSADICAPQAGANCRRFASVLGGVVPIYNLKGLNKDLKFTPDALADIYLGKIKKWNDPKIRSSNKSVDLPDADILVIHRSDGSGTTYAWSDFLSKVSSDWKDTVGTGTTLKWPVGTGVERNEGVASAVQGTPNSVGYVELVYAIQHELSFGAVRNSSGEYVRADLNSLAEAAKATTRTATLASISSITDPPGRDAYPIATFTWLLLPRGQEVSAKKSAAIELLRWILTSGQKECSALGYAPLPREVATQQLELLNTLK